MYIYTISLDSIKYTIAEAAFSAASNTPSTLGRGDIDRVSTTTYPIKLITNTRSNKPPTKAIPRK